MGKENNGHRIQSREKWLRNEKEETEQGHTLLKL